MSLKRQSFTSEGGQDLKKKLSKKKLYLLLFYFYQPSVFSNKIISMVMMFFLSYENWMINSGIQKKLVKIKSGDDVDILS